MFLNSIFNYYYIQLYFCELRQLIVIISLVHSRGLEIQSPLCGKH